MSRFEFLLRSCKLRRNIMHSWTEWEGRTRKFASRSWPTLISWLRFNYFTCPAWPRPILSLFFKPVSLQAVRLSRRYRIRHFHKECSIFLDKNVRGGGGGAHGTDKKLNDFYRFQSCWWPRKRVLRWEGNDQYEDCWPPSVSRRGVLCPGKIFCGKLE